MDGATIPWGKPTGGCTDGGVTGKSVIGKPRETVGLQSRETKAMG